MAVFHLGNQPEPSFQSIKTQTAAALTLDGHREMIAVSAETKISELVRSRQVRIQTGDIVATHNRVLVVDAAVQIDFLHDPCTASQEEPVSTMGGTQE